MSRLFGISILDFIPSKNITHYPFNSSFLHSYSPGIFCFWPVSLWTGRDRKCFILFLRSNFILYICFTPRMSSLLWPVWEMALPKQFLPVLRSVSKSANYCWIIQSIFLTLCSVSKKHLLTTARVCSARSATSSKVVTGDGRPYNVKQFIFHPSDSESDAVAHDIAVVVTAIAMIFNGVTVGPACLPF